ncbi:3-hydroxybutyryl-CoA dehydratase [Lachnospiraceae bacterium XBD2001]|nr:3-hydroxybutyryl-CoA dehydratase [Lachnospiraceae bacterium XBD2001]
MLEVGQTGSFSKTITESDIYTFAGLTGDFNSVHIDETAAEKSVFKKRIAHGMLTGSFISTVLGTKFPGPGTIYLEQNLKFLKPVYIQDTVTATVVLEEVLNPDKGIYRLKTTVTNQNDEIVSDGTAVVLYSER